jgi:hypothetical protein
MVIFENNNFNLGHYGHFKNERLSYVIPDGIQIVPDRHFSTNISSLPGLKFLHPRGMKYL